MATLADSFLADLEELSDNEADVPVEDDDNVDNMGEDLDGDLADLEKLNYDDLDSVSKLQKSPKFADIMQKVKDALQDSDMSYHGLVLEDDPEYQLIVDCNALSVDIENELVIIHNFIRDKYRPKFPELESLVHHPIDYARVVQKIGNEVDVTLVDLEGLLPSATIMVVSVTASTTSGKPLPEDVLEKTVDACDRALALDSAKKRFLILLKVEWVLLHQIFLLLLGVLLQRNLWGWPVVFLPWLKCLLVMFNFLVLRKRTWLGFPQHHHNIVLVMLRKRRYFKQHPLLLRCVPVGSWLQNQPLRHGWIPQEQIPLGTLEKHSTRRSVRKLRNGRSLLLQSNLNHFQFLILNLRRREVDVD